MTRLTLFKPCVCLPCALSDTNISLHSCYVFSSPLQLSSWFLAFFFILLWQIGANRLKSEVKLRTPTTNCCHLGKEGPGLVGQIGMNMKSWILLLSVYSHWVSECYLSSPSPNVKSYTLFPRFSPHSCCPESNISFLQNWWFKESIFWELICQDNYKPVKDVSRLFLAFPY